MGLNISEEDWDEANLAANRITVLLKQGASIAIGAMMDLTTGRQFIGMVVNLGGIKGGSKGGHVAILPIGEFIPVKGMRNIVILGPDGEIVGPKNMGDMTEELMEKLGPDLDEFIKKFIEEGETL